MNENGTNPNQQQNPEQKTQILQPEDKSANQLDMLTPYLSSNKGDYFNIGKELLRSPNSLLEAAVLGRVKEDHVQLHVRMMYSHMNSSQGYVDPEQIITYGFTLSIGLKGMARKEGIAASSNGYGYGVPDGSNSLNPIQKLIHHEKKNQG